MRIHLIPVLVFFAILRTALLINHTHASELKWKVEVYAV